MMTSIELVEDLRYTLRMYGVPIDGIVSAIFIMKLCIKYTSSRIYVAK